MDGQRQHVFQSSLRATAKLHLLSPAVFPLPFAGLPAVPAGHDMPAVAGLQTGSAGGTATAEAAIRAPNKAAIQPRVCTCMEFKDGKMKETTAESRVVCVGPVAHLTGGLGKALSMVEANPDAEVRTPGEAFDETPELTQTCTRSVYMSSKYISSRRSMKLP